MKQIVWAGSADAEPCAKIGRTGSFQWCIFYLCLETILHLIIISYY